MQENGRLLSKFKVGLSGAIPERTQWGDRALDIEILEFIRNFSAIIMKYGGTIVHGMHPTFTPILLKQAQKFYGNYTHRQLVLVGSSLWLKDEPAENIEKYKKYSELIITDQIGQGDTNDAKTRNNSLTEMRKILIKQMNVFVAIGGKFHQNSIIKPGVMEELTIAQDSELPCFLLPAFGGKTESIFNNIEDYNYYINHNKMDEEEFKRFLQVDDVYKYPGILLSHFSKHQELAKNREKEEVYAAQEVYLAEPDESQEIENNPEIHNDRTESIDNEENDRELFT